MKKNEANKLIIDREKKMQMMFRNKDEIDESDI
jgi:hypothetical protein